MKDKVHLRIGKSGITDGLIQEIDRQFEQSDPLTIRLLKNFCDMNDRKQAVQELAEKTKSKISFFRGGTLQLTRKG